MANISYKHILATPIGVALAKVDNDHVLPSQKLIITLGRGNAIYINCSSPDKSDEDMLIKRLSAAVDLLTCGTATNLFNIENFVNGLRKDGFKVTVRRMRRGSIYLAPECRNPLVISCEQFTDSPYRVLTLVDPICDPFSIDFHQDRKRYWLINMVVNKTPLNKFRVSMPLNYSDLPLSLADDLLKAILSDMESHSERGVALGASNFIKAIKDVFIKHNTIVTVEHVTIIRG